MTPWLPQDTWETPRRGYNKDEDDDEENEDGVEDEVDRDAEEEGGDTAAKTWDKVTEEGNEVSPEDGLQDLQYFPNFYRLLRSLDSGKDSLEMFHSIQREKLLLSWRYFSARMSMRLFCPPN